TRSAHATPSAIPVRRRTRVCPEPHRILFRADLGTSQRRVPFRSRCHCDVTELRRADLLLELLPPVPLAAPQFRNHPAHRVGGAFLPPSLLRDLDGGRSCKH